MICPRVFGPLLGSESGSWLLLLSRTGWLASIAVSRCFVSERALWKIT